jgi:hypothetical protein
MLQNKKDLHHHNHLESLEAIKAMFQKFEEIHNFENILFLFQQLNLEFKKAMTQAIIY